MLDTRGRENTSNRKPTSRRTGVLIKREAIVLTLTRRIHVHASGITSLPAATQGNTRTYLELSRYALEERCRPHDAVADLSGLAGSN